MRVRACVQIMLTATLHAGLCFGRQSAIGRPLGRRHLPRALRSEAVAAGTGTARVAVLASSLLQRRELLMGLGAGNLVYYRSIDVYMIQIYRVYNYFIPIDL